MALHELLLFLAGHKLAYWASTKWHIGQVLSSCGVGPKFAGRCCLLFLHGTAVVVRIALTLHTVTGFWVVT